MTRGETGALKDHIVRLYYERYNCRQIAELTGVTYRHVLDSLRERGITPRQRGHRGRYAARPERQASENP